MRGMRCQVEDIYNNLLSIPAPPSGASEAAWKLAAPLTGAGSEKARFERWGIHNYQGKTGGCRTLIERRGVATAPHRLNLRRFWRGSAGGLGRGLHFKPPERPSSRTGGSLRRPSETSSSSTPKNPGRGTAHGFAGWLLNQNT